VTGLRYIKGVALGALLFMATSGCSYVEQFFVINLSGKPVLVTARAATLTNVKTAEQVCAWASQSRPLRVVAAEKIGRDLVAMNEMTEASGAGWAETSCTIRVTVAPHEAVLLWSTSNGLRVGFPTRIVVGETSLILEGDRLDRRFNKRSTNIYVLEYSPSRANRTRPPYKRRQPASGALHLFGILNSVRTEWGDPAARG
jgi:hypothetical protein